MWLGLGEDIRIAIQELKIAMAPLSGVSLVTKSGEEVVERLPMNYSSLP